MNATARKLSNDPAWRAIYEAQLKDSLARNFAREVSEEEIKAGERKVERFILRLIKWH